MTHTERAEVMREVAERLRRDGGTELRLPLRRDGRVLGYSGDLARQFADIVNSYADHEDYLARQDSEQKPKRRRRAA
jgi:hypothetical protein